VQIASCQVCSLSGFSTPLIVRALGTPDLTLAFQNHEALADVSFHPCVRIPKWLKDRTLSFVPPDGRFNLMSYRYDTDQGADSTKTNVQLPLSFKHNYLRSEDSVTLEFFITSRMRDNLEGFSLQLIVGEGARGVNCLNSAGSSWGFDPKSLVSEPSCIPIIC
jgi:AP-3 complex subunit mu